MNICRPRRSPETAAGDTITAAHVLSDPHAGTKIWGRSWSAAVIDGDNAAELELTA